MLFAFMIIFRYIPKRDDFSNSTRTRQRFGVRQPQLPLLYVRTLPVGYESGSCGYRTPNWR
jgi:hypothetical protein